MKKLLSILLALVIVVSAFSTLSFAAFAADDVLKVTVNGVTTEVPVGETFTYTYAVSDMRLLNTEASVAYDSSKLSLYAVSDEDEEAYEIFLADTFPVVSPTAVCNTDIADVIYYNFTSSGGYRFVGEQPIATFEFTAISAGETEITTTVYEMVNSSKEYLVRKTHNGPEKLIDYDYAEYITYEAPVIPTEPPTEAPTQPAKADKVSNVTVTATKQASITLSWDAVNGAAKYWVYKQMTDGSFACVNSTTETTYTVANLNPGTEYSFKVLFSDETGAFSPIAKADVVTASTQQAFDIKDISGTARLVDADITWEPVDGAVKYWLYKAWEENGPFYCYDCTTETSYTVRRLQAATDYYFKVITVTEEDGKLVLSKLEDAPTLHVKTEEAEKITVKIDSVDKTSISFSWPAFDNALRYWIKFSNTTKHTNLTEEWVTYTAVDPSVTSYTLNGRKPNTPYYITIEVEYPDPQTGREFANYIAADTKTWYSNENFFTFEKQSNGGLVVSWPEDVNSSKSWMYVYDKNGKLVVSNASTTNSMSFSFAYDWESCTFALKTMDADSTGRLITPELGWPYK